MHTRTHTHTCMHTHTHMYTYMHLHLHRSKQRWEKRRAGREGREWQAKAHWHEQCNYFWSQSQHIKVFWGRIGHEIDQHCILCLTLVYCRLFFSKTSCDVALTMNWLLQFFLHNAGLRLTALQTGFLEPGRHALEWYLPPPPAIPGLDNVGGQSWGWEMCPALVRVSSGLRRTWLSSWGDSGSWSPGEETEWERGGGEFSIGTPGFYFEKVGLRGGTRRWTIERFSCIWGSQGAA